MGVSLLVIAPAAASRRAGGLFAAIAKGISPKSLYQLLIPRRWGGAEEGVPAASGRDTTAHGKPPTFFSARQRERGEGQNRAVPPLPHCSVHGGASCMVA
jgi:hypothetical protein